MVVVVGGVVMVVVVGAAVVVVVVGVAVVVLVVGGAVVVVVVGAPVVVVLASPIGLLLSKPTAPYSGCNFKTKRKKIMKLMTKTYLQILRPIG